MRLDKASIYLSICFISILCLNACSPSYPELHLTINESQPINQEYIICHELLSTSNSQKAVNKNIKSSLKKLVNEEKITNIIDPFDKRGGKIDLKFSQIPDRLRLDEYWIITDEGKFYGTTDIIPHDEIQDGNNPYSIFIEKELGGLANPENPEKLLPIPRGMVVTAVFGEKQVLYVFVVVPNKW